MDAADRRGADVPFAILGALVLTWIRGLENDVYFQVGLVTLVGLAAKNAILICEFAIERVHKGMAPREAAIEAAGLRMRAIVMTSFAFILGCVPLAIASGPGANSLRAIGTGVIGGMLASTLIAIFFVPLFFWILESASERFGGGKAPGGGAAKPAAPLKSGRAIEVRSAALCIAAGALLTACAVGPDYQRPKNRIARRLAHRLPQGGRGRQHEVVAAVRRPRAQPAHRDGAAREP